VKRNGKKELVLSGTTMNVRIGDKIELLSAFSDASCGNEYPINVKGYVPPGVVWNNGDDRGYVVTIKKEEFMLKYSVNGDGATYPVVVNHNGLELGRFMLHME